MALGVTGNVAKDGYAIGIDINSGSEAEARDAALKYCQTHGSTVARAKCEIFATFRNQCAAEAEDFKAGTPGAGWAIAADKAAAEKMAMMIAERPPAIAAVSARSSARCATANSAAALGAATNTRCDANAGGKAAIGASIKRLHWQSGAYDR